MKKFLRYMVLFSVVLQSAIGLSVYGLTSSVAQAQDERGAVVDTPAPAEATEAYDYVTQPSDCYTKMARKAIQTYGITYKVNLSPAKIVYAETNLTLAAGSPELDDGQKVSIKEADVKAWVDKADKLDAAKEKAWDAYTKYVNFNTDKVGQVS